MVEVGGDAAELTAASSSLGVAGVVDDRGAAAADRTRSRVRDLGANEERGGREQGAGRRPLI